MKLTGVAASLVVVSLSLTTFNAIACTAKAYNDFDFWLGTWQVATADGEIAGHNRIEKSFNNCVVTEHYKTKEGPYGTSLNIYDHTTDKWYQTWVDKTGLRLQLSGGLHGKSMVLTGKTMTKEGAMRQHKISWTPQQNGSVIQHWEMRKAEDENWQMLFKGIYTKL